MSKTSLRTKIVSLFLAFALLVTCAVPSLVQANDECVASAATNVSFVAIDCSAAGNVCVRVGANASAGIMGYTYRGFLYRYLGTSGDYYKIQYTTNSIGYVSKSYSSLNTLYQINLKTTTTTSGLNIRYFPKGANSVFGQNNLAGSYSSGASVTVYGVLANSYNNQTWALVMYNSRPCWVAANYLASTSGAASFVVLDADGSVFDFTY